MAAPLARADEPERVTEHARFPIADVELAGGLVAEDTLFHTGFGRLASAGGGFRVALTMLPNGIVPHLEDRVLFTNGLWLAHDISCAIGSGNMNDLADAFGVTASRAPRDERGCDASYVLMPVGVAWSISVAPRVNVFLEPGLVAWARTPPEPCPAGADCPNRGIFPSLEVGARYVLGEHAAVVARVGYPFVSLGLAGM